MRREGDFFMTKFLLLAMSFLLTASSSQAATLKSILALSNDGLHSLTADFRESYSLFELETGDYATVEKMYSYRLKKNPKEPRESTIKQILHVISHEMGNPMIQTEVKKIERNE